MSRGLGDVYKRQEKVISETENKIILDIPKSGQYGVYLKNVSSDRVTISQGILTVERGK